jgi:lipopolysaccharide biosynthesis protein
LERADLNEADIWGINDSYAHRYHLQSYFLIFNRRALSEPKLKRFWDRLLYARSKSFVIRYYELGLSHTALKAGLRLKALCPYRELVKTTLDSLERLPLATPKQRAKLSHGDYMKWLYDTLQSGIPINPSHYFWDGMLLQHSCPFIKRELLTKNPAHIPQLLQWEELIHQVSNYDSSLIVRHLQQVLRNRCV